MQTTEVYCVFMIKCLDIINQYTRYRHDRKIRRMLARHVNSLLSIELDKTGDREALDSRFSRFESGLAQKLKELQLPQSLGAEVLWDFYMRWASTEYRGGEYLQGWRSLAKAFKVHARCFGRREFWHIFARAFLIARRRLGMNVA